MSCNTTTRRLADAATRSGISASVSQKSFYFGLAAVSSLLAGLLMSYQRLRRRISIRPSVKMATTLTQLPVLSGPERIEPISANNLSGQSCVQCQTQAQQKSGLWYRIQGQTYCPTCAPARAEKAKVSLVPPTAPNQAPSITSAVPKSSFTPRRTTLQPKAIKVGPIDNLEGYAVLVKGKETGLSLIPEVKVEVRDKLRINKARWFVNYDQEARPIAGPFESVKQAQGMASLLANLDWNQSVNDFAEGDVKIAVQIATSYRKELNLAGRQR